MDDRMAMVLAKMANMARQIGSQQARMDLAEGMLENLKDEVMTINEDGGTLQADEAEKLLANIEQFLES